MSNRRATSDNPARDTYTSGHNWGLMLLALFGFTAPEGVVWYTSQFYALAYMQTVLMIPYITVYVVMAFALLLGAPFFIFWGWLSDRFDNRETARAQLWKDCLVAQNVTRHHRLDREHRLDHAPGERRERHLPFLLPLAPDGAEHGRVEREAIPHLGAHEQLLDVVGRPRRGPPRRPASALRTHPRTRT